MSSLPPYNPQVGDRAVWLVAAGSAADLPAEWEGKWTSAVVDRDELAGAVAALTGMVVAVIADPSQVVAPGSGWQLVAGAPGFVEAVLRRLMSMPDGTARFPVVPGARSVVQLLPDRAVLVRLNDGLALDLAP